MEAEITAMHPIHSDYRLCAWLEEDTPDIEECYFHIQDLVVVKKATPK